MAYTRKGLDSDVYVYLASTASLHCAGCALAPVGVDPDRHTARFGRAEDLMRHLEAHAQAGHRVPEGLIERLLREKDAIDKWILKHLGARRDDRRVG